MFRSQLDSWFGKFDAAETGRVILKKCRAEESVSTAKVHNSHGGDGIGNPRADRFDQAARMPAFEPAMPSQYGVGIVARVERFLVLRLSDIPIATFRLVKMMTSGAGEPIVVQVERVAAVSDGASQFKHLRIVLLSGNLRRELTCDVFSTGLGQGDSKRAK